MTTRRVFVLVVGLIAVAVLSSCNLFQPPDTDTDLEEAIRIVVDNILPTAVPAGATYLCARMDEPLAPGSLVEEDAPALPEGVLAAQPKGLTIGEESHLFFLDLQPGAFFEHPVRLILVGRSGGHQVMDAVWWPRVNGEPVAEFRNLQPDDDHVVATNAVRHLVSGVTMQFDKFDLGVLTRVQREGFLIVQGLLVGEELYQASVDTYMNGVAFFNAYRTGFSELNGLVQSDAADTLAAIDSMADRGLSPITIYIVAHGGIDGIRLGGVSTTAQQFRNTFAAHPDTLFNFLLCSCHSGSFIDDLDSLPNVRVAQTACAADEGAWPDYDSLSGMDDYDPEDTGSEFLSALLAAAASIVDNNWDDIVARAVMYKIPATSALLDAAWFGALGQNSPFGLTSDLELVHRAGVEDPQRYRSWAQVITPIVVPIASSGG